MLKKHHAGTGTLQIMQKNHCPCLVDPFFFVKREESVKNEADSAQSELPSPHMPRDQINRHRRLRAKTIYELIVGKLKCIPVK